jgi:hypothetical protein
MSFNFNDFIGPETLHREYKEFSLHKTGVPFDMSQAEMYCETRLFDFDELVMSNIMKYIKQYIPKYVTGFWNANIDGEIYIGTDDYGIIKGIPIKHGSILDHARISDFIMNTIRKSVKCTETDDYAIPLTVDILPVENIVHINSIHPSYLVYLEKKKEFLSQYKNFIDSYKEWQSTYEIVNMKLVDIVNQPSYRNVLINFVTSSPDCNTNVLKTLHDESFQLPSLSGEDIKDIKHDINNVFYWVTHLKDKLSINHKKDKPIFLQRFKHRYVPYHLLISISDMIPYWKNIQLYLIRITCKKHERPMQFTYLNESQWVQCQRIVNPISNQPMCIPF